MRLVASLIVRNELGRYLEPCVEHLLDFCDEVAVLDDGSTDGTGAWLRGLAAAGRPVSSLTLGHGFDAHEGNARQSALDFAMISAPTHILAIDADEFVSDGEALRHELDQPSSFTAWSLEMAEVWEVDGDCLCVRHDGHWRPYPATVLYEVPPDASTSRDWRIPDKKLACGRTPVPVRSARGRRLTPALLHFGWTNPVTRRARYDRYMRIDGGRFHDIRHLRSIMAPDVELVGRPWPHGLDRYRAAITEGAVRTEP